MTYQLKIEIDSYWHPGTGKGQGSHLDSTTHRNSSGLPVLPGRTIKGIVRDAVERWESYKNNAVEGEQPVIQQLFGSSPDGEETKAGLLRFSDAGLEYREANYLATKPELMEGLYRTHFSTAIELEKGTAETNSLRGIEMVVPLTLYATIDTLSTASNQQLANSWNTIVQPALCLIHAVGAHRTRGFGRATLTLEEVAS